jgi:Ni/Co efflux regulator RcnB
MSQPNGRQRVTRTGLRPVAGLSTTTREEGMTMKQLFTVLVAAMFAATSFAALAQDKKGMDKKAAKSSSMDKKSSKSSMDKKSGGMDKKSGAMDKKAAKKSAKKSETK